MVGQEVCPDRAQEQVEYQHQVLGLDGVPGRGQQWPGHHGRRELVVRICQRVRVCVVDVRVEEVQRVIAERAGIPRQRPRLKGRVVRRLVDVVTPLADHRPGEDAGEDREQDYDDKAYRPAFFWLFDSGHDNNIKGKGRLLPPSGQNLF
jgi:hypothetical protein